MFVTDRHSLTRNFEMFAVCSSQTAKQIDGFSALGAGKKQRNKSPPQAPLSTTWCVCKSFSCTETPPESATNCGQPTSTRQRADRELAGTSSRRATCRRPSAARAAALARPRGAESIEHLDADRRGRGRGTDRGGARRSGSFCRDEHGSPRRSPKKLVFPPCRLDFPERPPTGDRLPCHTYEHPL